VHIRSITHCFKAKFLKFLSIFIYCNNLNPKLFYILHIPVQISFLMIQLITYFTNGMKFFSSFLLFVLNRATDGANGTAESVATVVPSHDIYGHSTFHVSDYCCRGCHHDDVACGPQISQPFCYVL